MQESIKQTKKFYSKLGFIFMFGTIGIYAVQLIPMYLAAAIKPEWMAHGNISLLISIVPMYVLGMPFLIWLLKKLPASAPERHDISVGWFLAVAVMCYAIMYCCNIAGNILTTIIGLLKGGMVQNVILDVATSSNMAITFVYMVICAPIFEEYIFRKLIIDSTLRYGQKVAVITSGLMFGLFHGNLNQFVYAFGLGVFLAILYVKTGNLKITIGLHMIINFLGGILGVLLLDLIDYERFMEVYAGGDIDALMQMMMDNLFGWTVYGIYMFLLFALVITGVILLIVFRKRFRLEQKETDIPRGRRFSAVILNPGMLVYCLFWVGMIVLQLFQ